MRVKMAFVIIALFSTGIVTISALPFHESRAVLKNRVFFDLSLFIAARKNLITNMLKVENRVSADTVFKLTFSGVG